MKRLGRVLGSLLVMVLTVASLQAMAETKMGGRDFNHMTTGFPLSGGHATAACETCHTGGVFKGTPKNCDGCHAVGSRIVATPKSSNHIVTDAPCESCHFNTATWLGARYNHGNAKTGQCKTCHNGRQATAKPASHNIGQKATASCDSCHRSFAWIPASWNHIGVVPKTCTNCHVPGGQSSISKPSSHTPTSIKGMNQCDDCHNTFGWYPALFKHNTGAACSSCHNGILAAGKPSGHVATVDECNQCHFNTTTWLGALGAKPANHIPYNGGVQCASCHIGNTVTTGPTLHTYVSSLACKTCHLKGTSYLGNMDKKDIGHEGWNGAGDCSQSGCHKPAGSRGVAFVKWD